MTADVAQADETRRPDPQTEAQHQPAVAALGSTRADRRPIPGHAGRIGDDPPHCQRAILEEDKMIVGAILSDGQRIELRCPSETQAMAYVAANYPRRRVVSWIYGL